VGVGPVRVPDSCARRLHDLRAILLGVAAAAALAPGIYKEEIAPRPRLSAGKS